MIRSILRRMPLVLLLMAALCTCAFADFGPKPSVVVEFDGAEQLEYYVTLLADEAQISGPNYKITDQDEPDIENAAVWERFLHYQDPDGLVFIGGVQKIEGNGTYDWSYYPPGRFRVLVYFPETDSFAAGAEIQEQYAFDSYFRMNLSSCAPNGTVGNGTVPVVRKYNMLWQVTAFLLRLAVTIVVESLMAVCFGFVKKRQLLLILAVNCVTQIAMNLLMLTQGAVQVFFIYVLQYALAELGVILAEGLVYYLALPKLGDTGNHKKIHPIRYAVVGNLASFVMGYLLSNWFPMMFS